MKLEFSRQIFFEKKSQILNFVKIRPVDAVFFFFMWTGRRTDGHDEANNRFSQFCERT
jgi:hypothetical protein